MQRSMLVTGAASGIGRAIATHFVRKGWFVGLADKDHAGLNRLSGELAGAFVALRIDVRDGAAWASAVEQFASAAANRMDVFVNNAGIAHCGRFEDIPLDAAMSVLETNLAGAVRGIYACLPLLRATPGSTIINIGSSSGLIGYPAMAVYSASKAGLMALSEALAIEFAPDGPHVMTVAPHFIDTPLLDSPYHSGGKGPSSRENQLSLVNRYRVEQVVNAVDRAISARPLRVLVGADAVKIDLLRRFAPRLLRRLVSDRWQKLMGMR